MPIPADIYQKLEDALMARLRAKLEVDQAKLAHENAEEKLREAESAVAAARAALEAHSWGPDGAATAFSGSEPWVDDQDETLENRILAYLKSVPSHTAKLEHIQEILGCNPNTLRGAASRMAQVGGLERVVSPTGAPIRGLYRLPGGAT